MKKILIFSLLIIMAIAVQAQQNKAEVLQNLEKKQATDQNATRTATLKASSRLFKSVDDLTSVIMVVPSGSVVTVLGSDSTYFHVTFEDNEGYILKRHAEINPPDVVATQPSGQLQNIQEQPEPDQADSRFAYLENKYGTTMANRLFSHKIWKGMNSEMVRDSWGNPTQITRDVKGNTIQEQWVYRSTWLYFENNSLTDWGPVKK
jgi:hypothetical protein